MKLRFTYLLTLIFLFLNSCQYSPDELVPRLLSRTKGLQNGIEWDLVQNSYVKNKIRYQKDKNVDSGLSLVHIYINEARVTGEHGHYYPSALQILEEVLQVPSLSEVNRYKALTAKSGVLLSLHQFAEAKIVAEHAEQISPLNAQVSGALVDAYVELGDYEKAIEYADKMMSIRPDMRSYARVSYLREIYGDVEGAIEALKMSISAALPGSEEHAWAVHTLCELMIRYDRLEEAKSIYNQLLTVRPDYPFAIAGLAEIHMVRKEYDQAKEKLQEAISIIPEVGFYTSMARLHKIKGENQLYQKVCEEVLLMLKDDTDNGHIMNIEYAEFYLDLMDDPNTALDYALKEYEKRPDNIDVNRLLANIYSISSKPRLAKNYLDRASSTNSAHPELKQILERL